MSFTLADGKRQNCQNLRLDEHGIELCIKNKRPNNKLHLPPNKQKALVLRVIKAVNPADENSLDQSNVSSSTVRASRVQNKTALACLVGKPFVLGCDTFSGLDEPITDKNFTFVLRLNY